MKSDGRCRLKFDTEPRKITQLIEILFNRVNNIVINNAGECLNKHKRHTEKCINIGANAMFSRRFVRLDMIEEKYCSIYHRRKRVGCKHKFIDICFNAEISH